MDNSFVKEILRRNLDEEESGLENRVSKPSDIDQVYSEEDDIINNDSDLTD